MKQKFISPLVVRLALSVIACTLGPVVFAQAQSTGSARLINCDDGSPLCPDRKSRTNYEGQYIGHDEPSLIFYSNKRGAGNRYFSVITLPKDPPTLPKQDGTGGTFNFQLHPAFWYGMALCDTESDPNFTKVCKPDTDKNIFDDADPTSPRWIGRHPGTAFLELQFYAPGWIKWPFENGCDATRWCVAVAIFSLGDQENPFTSNNLDCLNTVGEETANFAFVTKNGVPLGPPDPLNSTLATFIPDPHKVLLMNSGDRIKVVVRDTPHGLSVVLRDLTTGESGFMVASAANGFAQVIFDPDPDPAHPSKTCRVRPYDFHPMYSTSSEHTRVPWAAHTYNTAFSDEIGHFEYCADDKIVAIGSFLGFPFGFCAVNPPTNRRRRDRDDIPCWFSFESSRVRVAGCTGSDFTFDGVPYRRVWPGSISDKEDVAELFPSPIRFTSFVSWKSNEEDEDGETQFFNYDRVAQEADLPAIEFAGVPPCNVLTGANCVNPPRGADFYPFYTTAEAESEGADKRAESEGAECVWQLGGAHIPDTINKFGGSSTTAYGPLLSSVFQNEAASIDLILNFRRIRRNPCKLSGARFGEDED